MVRSMLRLAVVLVALAALCVMPPAARAQAQQAGSQKRIALVIGNAAYPGAPLATTANDAGLVAQTLQAAGFDVVGARDLDEESLRRALRDFTDKAAASGPDTVAFVYLSGYGVQLDGENYLVPIDGKIGSAADVPTAALRVSDYTKRLAGLPLKARFVVLDAARQNPFARTGEPLAGGLALTDADPGSLVAFNAAPGTVGPSETGSYGAYAEALVEMIREGGLQPAELFDRVRLRVSERTKGGQVPWDAARIDAPFVFFERAADAPPSGRPAEVAALRSRPIREIGAQDAFAVCLERDTLQGYQDFLTAYPQDAMAKRVRAILAARREALTWRRVLGDGSREAFWSYLGRYPRGPHAFDARRRLARLDAALAPPPSYTPMVFDVPPPPVEEIVYVERPVLYLDDPVYGFAPPPPPPVFFLPPRPAYFIDLAPPPPPDVYYALPVPAFVPVPVYVSAPAYVVAPPNAVLYQNIHNTTVIEQINAASAQRGPGISPGAAIGAGAVVGAAAGLAAARVALPPSVAQKAALQPGGAPGAAGPGQIFQPGPSVQQGQGVQPGQGVQQGQAKSLAPPAAQGAPAPGAPTQAARPAAPAGQALPGFNGGQPLPQQAGRPAAPVAAPAQAKAPVPAAGPGQIPMQAVGKGAPQAPAAAATAPVPASDARSQAVKSQALPSQPSRIQALKAQPGGPGAGQPPAAAPVAPAANARQAVQQQRLQAAQQRQQAIAQQRQGQAQQKQQQMQVQAAQRAAAQQQQAGRQQQMMQQRQQQMQQQAQQAARQQQMHAIQQQQGLQRQMQQQQAARQQQMMHQQQMQQRAAPPPRAPPQPHCRPGEHCR